MSLRTLFVMDPLHRIDVKGDSTYMQMRDAQERGWPVFSCTPGDLFSRDGEAFAHAVAVRISPTEPHFDCGSAQDRSLAEFDVVWMRKDPPFDMNYIFSTYLLDQVPSSTLVLNDPAAIRNSNEKMVAMRWPELCPPTLVTREIRRAMQWAEAAGEKVVIKPWDGNGGRGVLVTRSGDPNLRSMLEVLTDEERTYILMQRYIPEILQGDKRIILIDGVPRGWMLRVPQPGDHRGNMHVGAIVQPCELSARDAEICEAIGPYLRENGLLFTGIDTIGSFLTEINVTSPTGIQEINALMGLHLERELGDAVERSWRARQDLHL
jgi:glutathione synthase